MMCVCRGFLLQSDVIPMQRLLTWALVHVIRELELWEPGLLSSRWARVEVVGHDRLKVPPTHWLVRDDGSWDPDGALDAHYVYGNFDMGGTLLFAVTVLLLCGDCAVAVPWSVTVR